MLRAAGALTSFDAGQRALFAIIVVGLFSYLTAARAQTAPANAAASQPNGVKRALIICGHPGDENHRTLFLSNVAAIRSSLTDRFGFDERHVWLRFGKDDDDANGPPASRGPATREALQSEASQMTKLLRPDDELWVFVIGHAHPGLREVQLNLPGPDVTAADFAGWFADIVCRRSVFFVTTPLSGFFTRALAQSNRVVIAATEADLELNETLFPSSLAKTMESFGADPSHDVDRDGTFSLLDLYVTVVRDVAAHYLEEELLATEHANLDDNGDGRGSELQLDYPVDPQEVAARRRIRKVSQSDGAFSKSIDLGSMLPNGGAAEIMD